MVAKFQNEGWKMKEVKDIFRQIESLDQYEKNKELRYLSAKILGEVFKNDENAIASLATIIVGETLIGGNVDEKEFLMIYPALVIVFGQDYSFSSAKSNFNGRIVESNRKISECAKKLGCALKENDEQSDALALLSLVYANSRRLPLKSKLYVSKLSMII